MPERMCQPELCTQHLDTVKGRQSGKRNHLHLFSPLLFRWGSLVVNTVNVTLPSVSITLVLLSCRADIVGSSENYCQDNQTWQYPHPICKSKCAAVYLILATHVREYACVSLRPRGSFKINRRNALHVGLLCVLTFVFKKVKTYMCRCVKLSKSKKETDRHKPLYCSPFQELQLFYSAFLPSCGLLWNCMACYTLIIQYV